MAPSLRHFLRTVAEIESNSWWADAVGPELKRCDFTYSVSADGLASITHVPKEPFESLLIHVRRLTLADSSERLHAVRKLLKGSALYDSDRKLLDVWHKYWRLAFIKEPFELVSPQKTEIMTGYRVYDCFINGYYFHGDSAYQAILYGASVREPVLLPNSFFKNILHSAVANLCLAAIALDRFVKNNYTFAGLALNPGMSTVFDFVWHRNRLDQLVEQYNIFNDWIERRGECKNCRWT